MNLPDGRAGGEAGRRGGHGVRCSAQGAHQPCLPLHSRCLTKQMLPYLPRPCAAPRPTPAAPPARRAPPGVGLAAGLEQGQQHWVVLVAAVVQGLLVQVGEQLHALGTARGGLDTRPALCTGGSPTPQPHSAWLPFPEPGGPTQQECTTHGGERSPGLSAGADTTELGQVPRWKPGESRCAGAQKPQARVRAGA